MENVNCIGDRVYVTGETTYGDNIYRISSYGTIVKLNLNSILITVDIIDGDTNATVLVNKKNISKCINELH